MNTFSLWIGFGIALGLAWIDWYGQKVERAPLPQVRLRLNTALIVLLGALVGSRLGYVLVNWGYFQFHLVETFQVWLGGLTGAGAYIGGGLTFLVYTRLRKLHAASLLDGLLPLALTLTLAIWLACWQSGVAYGPKVDAFWGITARDEWGVLARRWPVQPVGAALAALTFGLVDLLQPLYRRAGQKAALGLTLLAGQVFALTFFRADPAPLWQGLRVDSWAWLAAAGASLMVLLISLTAPKTGLLRKPIRSHG